MTGKDAGESTSPSRVVAEIVRAIFVLAEVGLAVLLVAITVIGFVDAMTADLPATDGRSVGFGDVAIFGIAAGLASAGAIASVRLWLKGSWHVVSVAAGTAVLVIGLALVLFYANGPGQH